MGKHEKRRALLRHLIDDRFGGIAARLAAAVDIDPSYITRMLYPEGKKGFKRIGEDSIEKIEVALKIPGYFSGEKAAHNLKPRDRTDDLQIPQLAVAGSMGRGAVPPEHLDVVRYLGASITELRRLFNFSAPQNLQLISAIGNSMEPTYQDGDILLVDIGVREVNIQTGVFVFTIVPRKDEGLFIKQLERRKNGLLMISHNRNVSEPELIPASDDVIIHGRVLLAWNARKL